MTCDKRENNREELKRRLPQAIVSVNNEWLLPSRKQAREHRDMSKDYHLVLQDDAILCKDFEEKAQKIFDEHHKIINFYTPWVETMRNYKKKKSFYKKLWWWVAVAIKTKYIDEMIERVLRRYEDGSELGDDQLMREYFWKYILCYYTNPCLVQHDVYESTFRWVENNKQRWVRQALLWIDDATT